jgi:hypothetical protein
VQLYARVLRCNPDARLRFGSIELLVGVLLNVPFGSTQGPADSTPSADIHEKQAILLGIQRSIAQLEGALQATQEELRSPQGEGCPEELTQRIKTLGGSCPGCGTRTVARVASASWLSWG